MDDFFGKAEEGFFGKDDVVQQRDVHQRAGGFDLPGLVDVVVARLRVSGGVVVGDNHLGGVLQQRLAEDCPGVDERGGQSALGKHFRCNHGLGGVQEDTPELLMVELGEVVP